MIILVTIEYNNNNIVTWFYIWRLGLNVLNTGNYLSTAYRLTDYTINHINKKNKKCTHRKTKERFTFNGQIFSNIKLWQLDIK